MKNNIDTNIEKIISVLNDKTISEKKRETYSKLLLDMNRLKDFDMRK